MANGNKRYGVKVKNSETRADKLKRNIVNSEKARPEKDNMNRESEPGKIQKIEA